MSPLVEELRREARVAFSPKAQPLWFRVVKWMVFGGITAYLWGTARFWVWISGALVLGVGVHLFWRSKTKGWTEPWIGWDDVETAEGRKNGTDSA